MSFPFYYYCKFLHGIVLLWDCNHSIKHMCVVIINRRSGQFDVVGSAQARGAGGTAVLFQFILTSSEVANCFVCFFFFFPYKFMPCELFFVLSESENFAFQTDI